MMIQQVGALVSILSCHRDHFLSPPHLVSSVLGCHQDNLQGEEDPEEIVGNHNQGKAIRIIQSSSGGRFSASLSWLSVYVHQV